MTRTPALGALLALPMLMSLATPAVAGPAPLVEPGGAAGGGTASDPSGGLSWLTDVLPVGAAVLVMAALLVVIAYLSGRHAGARVSTGT